MKISEVARIAGCSVRTIRHYHQQGFVPEPARLSNGYREYSLDDVVRIVRVRRLSAAGIPLQDVNQENFAEAVDRAIAAIDSAIVSLSEQRAELERLREGDLSLPPEGLLVELEALLHRLGCVPSETARQVNSWELLAVSGAATPHTWTQLAENVRDEQCNAHAAVEAQAWRELAAYEQGHAPEGLLATWLEAHLGGLMKDIYPTLQKASLDIKPRDMGLRGAQEDALRALVSHG